jgi:hypothetical protein
MKRKYIIRVLILILLVVLIDFSPVIYYKIFPAQGSWPNFYNYGNTTAKELIAELERIKSDKLKITYLPDTARNSHYTQVIFFDKSDLNYYHTWILVDTIECKNYTKIVFGYIGKSDDYKLGKSINLDYDLLTNYFKTKAFEELVIDKLYVN